MCLRTEGRDPFLRRTTIERVDPGVSRPASARRSTTEHAGSAALAGTAILLLSACDTGFDGRLRRWHRSDRHGPDGTDRVRRPGRGDGADGRGGPRRDLERNLGHGHPSGQWDVLLDDRGHAERLQGHDDIQDTSCVSNGQVDIALDGDTITMGSIQTEQPITFTGTVSGDTMSGTYDASACPPPNTGSWEAVRSG
jgi:hypothetical protein